jgi:hypothetical protein
MTLALEGDEAGIVGTFTRVWGDYCLRDTPRARITAWLVVAAANNRVAVGLPDVLPQEITAVAQFVNAHPGQELRAVPMPLDELRYVGWWSGLVLSAGEGFRRLPRDR